MLTSRVVIRFRDKFRHLLTIRAVLRVRAMIRHLLTSRVRVMHLLKNHH